MTELAGEFLITDAEYARVRAHYSRALSWLDRHFAGTPVVGVSFPHGFAGDAVYHKSWQHLPDTIATVHVRTSTGVHPYVRFDAHNVTWLCAAHAVVELHGWSPTLDDPDRAMFARLVLSPHGLANEAQLYDAARVLRERLTHEHLHAIPLLDGFRSMCLWIPFDDGPSYDAVAAWLRGFAADAAEHEPRLLTVEPLRADRGDRIYLGTKSNHPGMGSLLPYALRGTPALDVSIPIAWDDLGRVHNGDVNEGGFAEYMRLFGDVFAHERQRIGGQSFGDRDPRRRLPARLPDAHEREERSAFLQSASDRTARRYVPAQPLAAPEPTPRNYIVSAALAVLTDGAAHDADDILAQGRARGLLPASTTRKYVYTALHEYVVRTLGAGRTPEIVQVDGTATFRLNVPADPWPNVALPALPQWLDAATVAAVAARVQATGSGEPAAFEVAVCDAFGALGFIATHVGGNGEPDGILAAPLGVAGYRVVLECKTASAGNVASNPRPEEAAKFRAAAGATLALLIAPAFGNDASLDDELHQHGVALWTVADLVRALELQPGPDELRPAFEPGRAAHALAGIAWERDHGVRKRVAVLADRLARAGWATQCALAHGVPLEETPPLTEATLFVVLDEALVAEGITEGATLDEARAAIAALEVAGRLRRAGDAYVVRQPPTGSPSGIAAADAATR